MHLSDYPKIVRSNNATGVLILEDSQVFWGQGFGAVGSRVGEVCFNTAMTGYQEILSDPSYAEQIITFTFPHIGNVGTNHEDLETHTPSIKGLVVHWTVTDPSNWRSTQHFDQWLRNHDIVGLCGVDTRLLTRRIRDDGAPKGVLCHAADGYFDLEDLHQRAVSWPGLEGLDLAKSVSCHQSFFWDQTQWHFDRSYGSLDSCSVGEFPHVIAIDYGAKRNILQNLAQSGCRTTVVPATTCFEEIMHHQPDGIFLSNGPGDPAATGHYAVPVLQDLIKTDIPIFGICLGHQLLALALGAKTEKMLYGHRGANHPVKNLETGKVEITAQNHGFKIIPESLPENTEVTHISLFDGTNEGIRVKDRPIFSVQYHPEASPGPHDSYFLFDRFRKMLG